MHLIGLIGFSGSGKTTIAKALGMTRLAFADVLKRKAAQALGIGVDELEARKGEFRPLLVELGKAGRRIDPLRWVTPVMEKIGEADAVIDDVRYLNECEAIMARGGRCFYIHRPGVLPANEEENQSIAAIFGAYDVAIIPTTHNHTTPEDAAARIMAAMAK